MNIINYIFDLDDTLYNEITYVEQALSNVASYLATKYKLSYNELNQQMMRLLEEDGRGKIFNSICSIYNLNEDIKALVDLYRDTIPKLKLYPDAKEFLEFCKSSHIQTGIITDGFSKVQHRKIDALNLKDIVNHIIVTDDIGTGYWKPSVSPFQDMIKYLDCYPSEAVYIGDNPNKDFIGAKKAGLYTIRIVRETGSHMRDIVNAEYEAAKKVNSLSELLGMVEKGETL